MGMCLSKWSSFVWIRVKVCLGEVNLERGVPGGVGSAEAVLLRLIGFNVLRRSTHLPSYWGCLSPGMFHRPCCPHERRRASSSHGW